MRELYNCKSSINLNSKPNFTKLLKMRRNEDTAKKQDDNQCYRFGNKGDSSNWFSSTAKDTQLHFPKIHKMNIVHNNVGGL